MIEISKIKSSKILREIPGKRRVIDAIIDGEKIIVKYFNKRKVVEASYDKEALLLNFSIKKLIILKSLLEYSISMKLVLQPQRFIRLEYCQMNIT